MKRNSVFSKIVILGLVGAFAALALATPALAQKAQLLADAQKMMSDGWKQLNDGQRAIIEGWKMNNLVAVQKGVESKMAPGNQTITTGRDTILQGDKLFGQGVKTYMENKADAGVAAKGIEMMRDGFKIAKDGQEMIKKGVAMNDQVAQTGGFAKEFAQGDQTIKTGLGSMEGGAKLFMQGEAIYLKNK
jgi:hypothetical protein